MENNWNILQDALLDDLVAKVRDTQMTRTEYKFISDTIYSIESPNVLIFGTGYDSNLWINSNRNGRTVFLEPDLTWVNHSKTHSPDIDVRHVHYTTHPNEALDLFFEYAKTRVFPKLPTLDADIVETDWDVIFIDSPVGAVNGRMTSIFLASELSRKKDRDVHIFLHDSQRHIETLYGRLFLLPDAKKVEQYNFNTNEFNLLNYYVR
jgi:uncharacterized protein (TIGR01627 family)